ncbi:NAC domain-containing protein 96-like [Rosa chinensis]|uniref:NAC domain-containing protein 96-like n=1 Tax=Rosa chinensis TaxID=74649 RepID=UPI000D087E34|nr:NAC domain-containing protein 96-like [Rosa chinensis]
MSTVMPTGFRFHPKDHELVSYYLYSKVNGDESVIPPPTYRMPEVDVYGEDLGEIRTARRRAVVFLCNCQEVNPNGKRIDRTTNSRLGTWSEGERSKPVDDENGNPIGTEEIPL